MPDPFSLSVIVPVWMEAAGVTDTLRALQPIRNRGHEVVVVDGGSTDRTVELARPLCDRVVVSEKGRALQMNAGAAVAKGDLLLFLHADTRLPEEALEHLASFVHSRRAWGRFEPTHAHQTLLSNEAWMCVRDEIPAKSIGLNRLKSGMEMELFEF